MGFPPGTQNPATITFRDAGNELSTFRCIGADITAANRDAQEALFTTLYGAAEDMVLGVITKSRYISETTQATVQPTNGAARELKLLIQYQVSSGINTGARWFCTLPTIDVTKVSYVQNVNAKDVVDPSVGAFLLAFIAAFEAFAKDPMNGTGTVNVVGLKIVGRRN